MNSYAICQKPRVGDGSPCPLLYAFGPGTDKVSHTVGKVSWRRVACCLAPKPKTLAAHPLSGA